MNPMWVRSCHPSEISIWAQSMPNMAPNANFFLLFSIESSKKFFAQVGEKSKWKNVINQASFTRLIAKSVKTGSKPVMTLFIVRFICIYILCRLVNNPNIKTKWNLPGITEHRYKQKLHKLELSVTYAFLLKRWKRNCAIA